MHRANGSFLFFCIVNWTKVQLYKIVRAHGSITQCDSSIGTGHIVATDFNPLDVK